MSSPSSTSLESAAKGEQTPQADKKTPLRPQKKSVLPILLGLFVLAAVVIGIPLWFVFRQPTVARADPGQPLPQEPPSPPAPFKTQLVERGFDPADAVLAQAADKIASTAGSLSPELLLASVDGSAPSRLIVSGSLERSADAISRIPRHERWEIRIDGGNTADSYTRQLDYFKIELGVIGVATDVIYLSNLSAPNPTAKTQSGAGEKRLYLIWQRGSMREADEEILARAKIASAGKVIVHFCPEELENELVKLEDDQARQAGLKRVRKTVFGVRPREPEGFRFFVIEQKADE